MKFVFEIVVPAVIDFGAKKKGLRGFNRWFRVPWVLLDISE